MPDQPAPPETAVVRVESIFGQRTRQPIVNVRIPDGVLADPGVAPREIAPGERVMQLTPEAATSLGFQLIEAAQSSILDGFLATFFESELGVDQEQWGAIFLKFRAYREERAAAEENG